ncbi:MAG: lamin tail domain-containing protein [Verrucomicrobiota bacterium]
MKKATLLTTVLASLAAFTARADLLITEVDSAGSANAGYGADWFEVWNNGAAAADITGWKMDDSSGLFSSSVALRGLTSIGAGQVAIFLESNSSGSNDATVGANFINTWFGGTLPSGVALGFYGGSGVGLTTSSPGDAVNLFNSSGTLQANVSFGAVVTTGSTFDNTAGLNNAVLSQASALGVNGAFQSLAGSEIGSPGFVIVPEPSVLALGGVAVAGLALRRRK